MPPPSDPEDRKETNWSLQPSTRIRRKPELKLAQDKGSQSIGDLATSSKRMRLGPRVRWTLAGLMSFK